MKNTNRTTSHTSTYSGTFERTLTAPDGTPFKRTRKEYAVNAVNDAVLAMLAADETLNTQAEYFRTPLHYDTVSFVIETAARQAVLTTIKTAYRKAPTEQLRSLLISFYQYINNAELTAGTADEYAWLDGVDFAEYEVINDIDTAQEWHKRNGYNTLIEDCLQTANAALIEDFSRRALPPLEWYAQKNEVTIEYKPLKKGGTREVKRSTMRTAYSAVNRLIHGERSARGQAIQTTAEYRSIVTTTYANGATETQEDIYTYTTATAYPVQLVDLSSRIAFITETVADSNATAEQLAVDGLLAYCRAELSDIQYSCLLYTFNGYTVRETAEALNISKSTVSYQLNKALKKLAGDRQLAIAYGII